MDNKLMENCIRDVLQEELDRNKDVMKVAEQLSDFHLLIQGSRDMYEGYKLYSRVSHAYYSKLEELGIIEPEDGDKEK